MSARNTETTYGSVARALHWIMAILIIGMWVLGLYMHELPRETPEQMQYKFGLYDIHKAFGMLALLFILFRMYWRMTNPIPVFPESMQKWEKMLAHAVHGLLMLLMLLFPVSGYLGSAAGGHSVPFFGLFEFPLILSKNEGLAEVFGEIHEICAWTIFFAFILHVVAALYHHFVKKDDILLRMSPHGQKSD
ncbi:cytochrome b [Emcibacter nanhaiensis]|uniref:Cytochrome b n=1 Tax=Emcibacter nanhaiensis TaxID=1505037 RepID=A0A501PBR8_9PROT|nr:cytochrome b [Emcibacter nanhaiensis]TPD57531.1 cytochrome b [Emcibacter nanhaiensis]